MNEFVHVTFPTRRSVLVDGTPDGFTNQTFVVQRGTHVFELAPPANFSPASLERTVVGTTRLTPLPILFTRIERAIRAAKKAAKRRTAKKRTAKKGAAKKGAAKQRAATKRAAKKRGAKKARPR